MSRDPLELLREDLRDFAGYRSARSERVQGEVWLNANEAARANAADADDGLRRYPQPQPDALVTALAALYGCTRDRLLVGRGSDEAIDLLVRAFCTPGRDAVLVTPPVFGMYAVCARLQGAGLVEVPLIDGPGDFSIDLGGVAAAAKAGGARLVFLCSPGNPAGGLLAADAVLDLACELDGAALIVVDEAYVEFADAPSLAGRVGEARNLVILRTLSKAHALAGARIGCAIADPGVIAALRRCQAPYPVPAPCTAQALQALSPPALARTQALVAETRTQRQSLRQELARLHGVGRVYPSQGNFLLVRFDDAEAAFRSLLDAGVVVRDMRAMPQLGDALRISIGTAEENARVLRALALAEIAA
ncbi:MAG TPA: histidinol-phosphate transaminase [Lysobacter sp.]|nr:histidinol-phosphate transaminase [Lysobacter sp.]